MLPVAWLVAAVVVAVLVTMWFTFTLTRLDRLHARVDAASAALETQLVRRAAALEHVLDGDGSAIGPDERVRLTAVARHAVEAGGTGIEADGRESAENAVGRAVTEVAGCRLAPDAVAELGETAARVLIARRFYNDAVRDTRALRTRRLPRLLRMAGHREMPQFFDIDDSVPDFAEEAS